LACDERVEGFGGFYGKKYVHLDSLPFHGGGRYSAVHGWDWTVDGRASPSRLAHPSC
jgi:hypothetical protein